jgi:3-dehydroquinate synthase
MRALGLSGKVMIVSDRHVGPLYLSRVKRVLRGAGFETHASEYLPPNESAKTQKTLFQIYSALVRAGFDRSSSLVSLGGGTVGDVTGFAAATFLRGLPWVAVPTTLLAQVDSAIGGKTGINLDWGKNLVGAFHQPRLVLSDINVLATLPRRDLCSSLGEVIKYAVIRDPAFFSFLETNMGKAVQGNLRILEHVVWHSARIKKEVVERDEREETGLRAILNYGHTFAHAFEAASGNWSVSMPHGEAVAAGMLAAGELAVRQGLFRPEDQARQERLIAKAGLPLSLNPRFRVRDILEGMKRDKKRKRGVIRFVLPRRIGRVMLADGIPMSEVKNVLASMGSR